MKIKNDQKKDEIIISHSFQFPISKNPNDFIQDFIDALRENVKRIYNIDTGTLRMAIGMQEMLLIHLLNGPITPRTLAQVAPLFAEPEYKKIAKRIVKLILTNKQYGEESEKKEISEKKQIIQTEEEKQKKNKKKKKQPKKSLRN
jgi:hypothetical protein